MSAKVKKIKEQIGYGFGTTIGYTEDGNVFIVSDTKGPEGRPMQSVMEVPPSRAREIAGSLVKAADTAEKQKDVANG